MAVASVATALPVICCGIGWKKAVCVDIRMSGLCALGTTFTSITHGFVRRAIAVRRAVTKHDTIAKIAEEGFTQEAIDASINSIEFNFNR